MHPSVHQSTTFPCPFFNKTSGAKYSGVPQTEKASFPTTPLLERPKSVILIYPSSSINTFSGLRLWLLIINII